MAHGTMSSSASITAPLIPPDCGLGATIRFAIDGMATARQKINICGDRLAYINWKASTSDTKANGAYEWAHKSLKDRRILSKEIVARKTKCRDSSTPTPTIAEVR